MPTDKRPIRVLMVKTSLDGHWRGPAVVSHAMRNAGMEVIYGGVMNPAQTSNAAIQEHVDVIGLNIGGGYTYVSELMRLLNEKNFKPLVIAGGTVPPRDIALLKEMGVEEFFPPGSSLDAIVEFIKGMISITSGT